MPEKWKKTNDLKSQTILALHLNGWASAFLYINTDPDAIIDHLTIAYKPDLIGHFQLVVVLKKTDDTYSLSNTLHNKGFIPAGIVLPKDQILAHFQNDWETQFKLSNTSPSILIQFIDALKEIEPSISDIQSDLNSKIIHRNFFDYDLNYFDNNFNKQIRYTYADKKHPRAPLFSPTLTTEPPSKLQKR